MSHDFNFFFGTVGHKTLNILFNLGRVKLSLTCSDAD